MQSIADYTGAFFNHMEGIFRPEDRELALELAQALGLTVQEIRFTETSRPIVALHPNGDDKDPTNNVFFLFPMPEGQQRVLDLMKVRIADDPELRAVIGEFRESARKMPPLMPHFGVRYRSSAELEAVTDRIANGLSPALKDRVSLFEVPHYDPVEGLPDIRQVFVTTDVFTIGTAGFEQAIELQVDRARP
ncbi:MAG: hypothetical protein H6917_12395 [Novosphingobium sp.]|nr:hypothetical protein [Novosphingobium sp.]MCP5403169.1 hypothetical protein [Novosphingobium sp.]